MSSPGRAARGPLPAPWADRCLSCGRPLAEDHSRCAFDPPRFCARCGRRLRVQVHPTGYLASCAHCDGPEGGEPEMGGPRPWEDKGPYRSG